MKFERGGFVLGLVVGLLIGLAVALGVALFITKAPTPFVNKVPQRTAEQDQAEAQRNRNWDPNAPLAGKSAQKPAAAASGVVAAAAAASVPPTGAPGAPGKARDPAAILSGAAVPPAASAPTRSTTVAGDPFTYFLQVGAFTSADEAEQQRAKLALAGWTARVTEREQSGRTVHRVRIGPIERREEAEAQQAKLTEAGHDARLVRVEKTNP